MANCCRLTRLPQISAAGKEAGNKYEGLVLGTGLKQKSTTATIKYLRDSFCATGPLYNRARPSARLQHRHGPALGVLVAVGVRGVEARVSVVSGLGMTNSH